MPSPARGSPFHSLGITMDERSRGDDYLAQYPRFLKWMNQCVA
jgi:hypothetical protein